MSDKLPRIPSKIYPGKLEHIFMEGSRFHVISWDGNGAYCSEPDCEVNEKRRIMMEKK